MDSTFAGRLYRRIMHKIFLRDLWFDLQLEAKREAVAYVQANMRDTVPKRDRLDLLSYAASEAKAAGLNGLVAEFGVSRGKTIRHLATLFPAVHGFDSFEGLPEDWAGTLETAGAFTRAGKLPKVPPHAALHVGWFDQTLPQFLADNPGPMSLLHLDADLYSSTKTVLDLCTPRMRPGTVLVFDEYFGYWGWRAHEFKALADWRTETGAMTEYLGFSTSGGQVAVRVVSAPGQRVT